MVVNASTAQSPVVRPIFENSEKPSIALYVHIPFCLTKCNYCDFNTYSGIEELMPTFVDALNREIELWSERIEHPEVTSIFFGGGTPSYLPTDAISRITETIFTNTLVRTDAEISLEANPDDVSASKLDAWLQAGFNRVSIGVQTFNDRLLGSLSRRHDGHAAANAVEAARSAGFDNISIDLMFGLPNQTTSDWELTLNRAIALETEHLSLYGLQIEEGTPLHRNVRTGATPRPDDDLAATMYEMAMDRLESAGYEHYEISNWSKTGYHSQHNLAYWRNRPYLGVGPGAHSSLQGCRFANLRSPKKYVSTFNGDVPHAEGTIHEGMFAVDFIELTTPQMAMSETMMLGIRLLDGVSRLEFETRFGRTLDDVYSDEIGELTQARLIDDDGDRIRLTRRGKLLGNLVFERFILSE